MLFKLDVITNSSCLFRFEFLFLIIQFYGYIDKNIYLGSIVEVLYFLKIQILPFNLVYQVGLVIPRKASFEIINLGKTLMMHTKSNNISLDNSSNKIIIGIKIFNLYAYSFLS